MSLRRQIILTVLLAVAAALLPTGLLLIWQTRQTWTRASEISGARIAQMLALSADLVEEHQPGSQATTGLSWSTSQQQVLQRLIYRLLDHNIHGIWLLNRQLQVLQFGTIADLGSEAQLSAADQALVQQAIQQNRTQSQLQDDYLKVATPINSLYETARGALLLYLPTASVEVNSRHQVQLALGMVGLSLGFGLLLSVGLARRLSQPLEQLRTAALAVAEGNLDILVTPAATDEVGDLALAFNQTTQQLKTTLTTLENRVAERTRDLAIKTQALQQSEAQQQAILAAIPDLMFQLSAEGIFLGYVNLSEVAALLPHNQDSTGQPLLDLLPMEVSQRHLSYLAIAIATRCTQVYEQQLEVGGKMQYEEVRVVAIDETKALFIIRNIGDRKRAEAALRQSNQDLAAALQSLKTAQADLIQSEKMAALGQLVAGVAHELNTPLGAIRSSVSNIANYLSQSLEALPQIQRLTAAELPQFLALLRQSLAKPLLLSARDERKYRRALSQTLSESGIMEADRLAETLVIMGIYQAEPFMNLLQPQVDLAPTQLAPTQLAPTQLAPTQLIELAYWLSGLQRSSQVIDQASAQASRVVLALKSYLHQSQTGEQVEADLLETIRTSLALHQNQLKRGIEVTCRFAPLPPILCYPDQLRQVWSHLIRNAIQAMQHHGLLEIEVACDQQQICVKITDTGAGIPAEIQPKIFQPFFTTKAAGEGSGLGLAVAQQIIKTHQGQISVESRPGRTVFQITLPLLSSRSNAATGAAHA